MAKKITQCIYCHHNDKHLEKNQGIRNLFICMLASRHLTQYVVVMEATVQWKGEEHRGMLDLLNLVKFMLALIDVLMVLQWKCSRLLDTKRPKFIQNSLNSLKIKVAVSQNGQPQPLFTT